MQLNDDCLLYVDEFSSWSVNLATTCRRFYRLLAWSYIRINSKTVKVWQQNIGWEMARYRVQDTRFSSMHVCDLPMIHVLDKYILPKIHMARHLVLEVGFQVAISKTLHDVLRSSTRLQRCTIHFRDDHTIVSDVNRLVTALFPLYRKVDMVNLTFDFAVSIIQCKNIIEAPSNTENIRICDIQFTYVGDAVTRHMIPSCSIKWEKCKKLERMSVSIFDCQGVIPGSFSLMFASICNAPVIKDVVLTLPCEDVVDDEHLSCTLQLFAGFQRCISKARLYLTISNVYVLGSFTAQTTKRLSEQNGQAYCQHVSPNLYFFCNTSGIEIIRFLNGMFDY